MSHGLSAPVLVLNRHFQPVRITTARRAFIMLYAGSARALDNLYEPHDFDAWRGRPLEGDQEYVGTPAGAIRVPRLVLLVKYARVPQAAVRLSRRNIFLRDAYTCQYCREKLPIRDLNLDHVMPRSRGGRSTWDNLVTSCRPCNLRKGGFTPEECGMALLRQPVRPTWSTVAQLVASPRRFVEWEPFLAGVNVPEEAVG